MKNPVSEAVKRKRKISGRCPAREVLSRMCPAENKINCPGGIQRRILLGRCVFSSNPDEGPVFPSFLLSSSLRDHHTEIMATYGKRRHCTENARENIGNTHLKFGGVLGTHLNKPRTLLCSLPNISVFRQKIIPYFRSPVPCSRVGGFGFLILFMWSPCLMALYVLQGNECNIRVRLSVSTYTCVRVHKAVDALVL